MSKFSEKDIFVVSKLADYLEYSVNSEMSYENGGAPSYRVISDMREYSDNFLEGSLSGELEKMSEYYEKKNYLGLMVALRNLKEVMCK